MTLNRHERHAQNARSKKGQSQPRPRTPFLKIESHVEGANLILGPPRSDGTIQLLDSATGTPWGMGDLQSGVGYERTKNIKIISQSPQCVDNIFLDQNNYLLSFENVFAVDTNTQTDSKRSISAITWLHNLLKKPNATIEVGSSFPRAYVFIAENGEQPERIGWKDAISRIIGSPEIRGSVALVVDSYLHELPRINRREIPVHDDYFLPENVTLVYSSAEVDTNKYIGPWAIRQSDLAAKRVLMQLAPDQQLPTYSIVPPP